MWVCINVISIFYIIYMYICRASSHLPLSPRRFAACSSQAFQSHQCCAGATCATGGTGGTGTAGGCGPTGRALGFGGCQGTLARRGDVPAEFLGKTMEKA